MPLLSDACLILFWDTVTYLEVIPTYLPMPLLRCFLNPILRYCDLHWGHTDLPTPALRPLQSWEGGTKSSFFVAGFDGLDSKLCADALWCIGETFNTFISWADCTCGTFQTEGCLDFAFRYIWLLLNFAHLYQFWWPRPIFKLLAYLSILSICSS